MRGYTSYRWSIFIGSVERFVMGNKHFHPEHNSEDPKYHPRYKGSFDYRYDLLKMKQRRDVRLL